MSNINLPLSGIADGGLQEKLDIELQKVFNNIHDSNTEAGTKRSITLKLTFKPNETRDVVDLITEFKTSLAPVVPIGTTLLTGRDLNTGLVEANELKSNAKGQTFMDFENNELKSDTGEKITDLRKKRGQQA